MSVFNVNQCQHGKLRYSKVTFCLVLLIGPHKTGWLNTVDRTMKRRYQPYSNRNQHTPSLPVPHLTDVQVCNVRWIAPLSVTQFCRTAPVTEEMAQIHLAHTCAGGQTKPHTHTHTVYQ